MASLIKINIPEIQRIRVEQSKRDFIKQHMDYDDKLQIYMHEGKIILPPNLEKEWTFKYHEPPLQGHAKAEEVLERLRRNYYFPRMRQKVFTWVRACHLCKKAKYERHKPYGLLQPNRAPERSWQEVSIDFIGPLPPSKDENNVEYENIMVAVDRLTKYAIFVPIPRQFTASYLAKVFLREVGKFGIPEKIISDRDKIFTSHFWRELCQVLQITQGMSTAYHPQSDGQTERVNQILEQYLRIYVNDEQSNWVQLLP